MTYLSLMDKWNALADFIQTPPPPPPLLRPDNQGGTQSSRSGKVMLAVGHRLWREPRSNPTQPHTAAAIMIASITDVSDRNEVALPYMFPNRQVEWLVSPTSVRAFPHMCRMSSRVRWCFVWVVVVVNHKYRGVHQGPKHRCRIFGTLCTLCAYSLHHGDWCSGSAATWVYQVISFHQRAPWCDVSRSSQTSTGGWPLHQGSSHRTAGLTGQHRSVTAQARDVCMHVLDATIQPCRNKGTISECHSVGAQSFTYCINGLDHCAPP